ncbi:proton-conducting transporter membrane subunit, partial [Agrobacterium tumefaciens]
MLIGIVDHEAGTRDLRVLAGRHVRMPITGTALTLAAVSMAGVPPLLGFVSKEGLLDAALGTPGPAWAAPVVTGAIALASVFTVAYSGRLVLGALGRWGASPAGTAQPWESTRGEEVHEASPAFWTMPVLA